MRDEPAEYEQLRRWRIQPHVVEWWWADGDPENLTTDHLIAEYGPSVRGQDPTVICFLELDGHPIGLLQFYSWESYPEEVAALEIELPTGYWGIDLFIGEPGLVGRGYGSQAVSLICHYLMTQCAATGVALVVNRENRRAQRAYEKAGLTRIDEILDTDTRNGERIPSYLMATQPSSR